VGTNEDASQELSDIFQKEMGSIFEYPKPTSLVEYLIKAVTKNSPSAIVLDSFSGSGTTGHAVLKLNNEDSQNNLRFILVEMEEHVAQKVTSERIKKVIRGYKAGKENINGLKGGFEYVELGDPLFSADGNINPSVEFDDLASYVYFTETHTHIDPKKISGSLIGEYNDTAYYLLFKKIGTNTLTKASLESMKAPGKKVVYADKCLVDQDALERHQVVFKQIPYSVRVY
jgi:hypothetical protein